MKLNFKYFLIIISIFSFVKCKSYYKSILKEDSKLVNNQYLLLLKESDKFLNEPNQKDFIKGLNKYILECKNYNFNDGREKAVILNPVIVNDNYNKAISFVLKRGSGISGSRIEFINLISAKYYNNEWNFKLREGHGFSFSYASLSYKSSTNEELIMEVIRNLMLMDYFKKGIIHDNSLFFSDWYTLK